MRYDSTLASKFEVKPRVWETLVNQNWLLTRYPGGIGGKIGWTVSSEATYIGLARRQGVTLIVTIMHCTPLQEITSAVKLLNWGFAMNAKVAPVGVLVPPLTAAAVRARPAGHGATNAEATTAGGPQALGSSSRPIGFAVAAGLTAAAALGLGGLARSRRKLTAGRRRH
jgi:D-alanyl-D-alanine carboxypeptidase (penicillin-binding protein 5/6)